MKKAVGFTLFEVLVSLFLVTLSLTTLLAANQAANRHTQSLHYFQQATWLAQNMSRYWYVHHAGGDYEHQWRKQIQTALPAGNGELTRINGKMRMIIAWGGMATTACTASRSGIRGCLIETLD